MRQQNKETDMKKRINDARTQSLIGERIRKLHLQPHQLHNTNSFIQSTAVIELASLTVRRRNRFQILVLGILNRHRKCHETHENYWNQPCAHCDVTREPSFANARRK